MKQFIDNLISRLEEETKDTCTEAVCSRYRACCYCRGVKNTIKIVNQFAEEYKGGWIRVEDRLPEDGDERFYMCIVENHEEDLPMYCQYDEEHGFGFWSDIYDEHTLGFVDSEFSTNEELGYEKVIAWKPIEPYQKEGE